jgi:hypothetical protein
MMHEGPVWLAGIGLFRRMIMLADRLMGAPGVGLVGSAWVLGLRVLGGRGTSVGLGFRLAP